MDLVHLHPAHVLVLAHTEIRPRSAFLSNACRYRVWPQATVGWMKGGKRGGNPGAPTLSLRLAQTRSPVECGTGEDVPLPQGGSDPLPAGAHGALGSHGWESRETSLDGSVHLPGPGHTAAAEDSSSHGASWSPESCR
jgi:hypothetical protein